VTGSKFRRGVVALATLPAMLVAAPAMGARPHRIFDRPLAGAISGALAPDGTIVVAGATGWPGPRRLRDAVVRKLSPDGRRVLWTTRLGGSRDEYVEDVAVGPDGDIWATGTTNSPDFPELRPNYGPVATFTGYPVRSPLFVARLSRDGAVLNSDVLTQAGEAVYGRIALDRAGNAFLVGYVYPAQVPALPPGPVQPRSGGSWEVFVSKLDRGWNPQWQTFLGGDRQDRPTALTVDGRGDLVIAGATFSDDYPTDAPFQPAPGGRGDGFISVLSADGTRLLGSSYFGGDGLEDLRGLAISRRGTIVISGTSRSQGLPGARLHRRWRYFTLGLSSDAHARLAVFHAARSSQLIVDGARNIWLHSESSLWGISGTGKPTTRRLYLRGLPFNVVVARHTVLGVGRIVHNNRCVVSSCPTRVAVFRIPG
jgi:hypothetical protein